MTPRRRASSLVAATLVAAAGLVGLGAGPSAAASCTTAGITAVVDYNDGAGGGTQSSCDATTSATNAAKVFGQVHVTMRRNPDGSVCQVNGKPAGAPCNRLGNQYWALWWSDGKSGSWVYSQQGVDSLTVPKNGSVAWAWQGASGRRQPAVAAPVVHPAPTPKPTPKPSPRPTPKPAKPTRATTSQHGTSATGTPAASGTTTPTATASTSASATARSTATATASPTPSASASVAPPSASSSQSPDAAAEQPATKLTSSTSDPDGLPLWVPGAVVVALLAATGGALWWRRASRGGPGPA